MNRPAIAALARRDLTVVARSRAVSLPIVILPLIFFVVLPAILTFAVGSLEQDIGEFQEIVDMMPAVLREDLAGLAPRAQVVVWALEYLFASLFLIVPLMVSTVIAADAFAGEKERKTTEALVYTPVSDADLYLGKLLAPWAAAVAVALVGFVGYAVAANLLGAGIVGRPIVVTPRWALVVLWLAPAVSALAVGALVHVSARVRGFQEAYQLGGFVVLPLVLLLVGQVTGVLYFDLVVIVLLGAVLWVAALVTLRLGFRSFRRERLLAAL